MSVSMLAWAGPDSIHYELTNFMFFNTRTPEKYFFSAFKAICMSGLLWLTKKAFGQT